MVPYHYLLCTGSFLALSHGSADPAHCCSLTHMPRGFQHHRSRNSLQIIKQTKICVVITHCASAWIFKPSLFRGSECAFTFTFHCYMPQISIRDTGTEKHGNKTSTSGWARSVLPELNASHNCSYIKYVFTILVKNSLEIFPHGVAQAQKFQGQVVTHMKMNSIPNGWVTKESFPKHHFFSDKVLDASAPLAKHSNL